MRDISSRRGSDDVGERRGSKIIQVPTPGAMAMTTVGNVAPTGSGRSGQMPADDSGEGVLARLGLRFTNWAERWFPDAYVFVALAVAVVAAAALINGAPAVAVAASFGDGFW